MVSIHRPLGYGPSTLPLRHSAYLWFVVFVAAQTSPPPVRVVYSTNKASACKRTSFFELEAGLSSGVAAQASEIRKHNSNDAKCVELGWVCIPLVVETYGAWGQEAVKTFAQLASRLAIACSKPKSVVINEIYGRLNTCLMRSISSAILTRIVPS